MLTRISNLDIELNIQGEKRERERRTCGYAVKIHSYTQTHN